MKLNRQIFAFLNKLYSFFSLQLVVSFCAGLWVDCGVLFLVLGNFVGSGEGSSFLEQYFLSINSQKASKR
jgi:hypothetical protein